MDWQPIETAPKDGKTVIIGWAGDFMPEICRYRVDDGVWVNDYADQVHAPPTHWMPLPDPPRD